MISSSHVVKIASPFTSGTGNCTVYGLHGGEGLQQGKGQCDSPPQWRVRERITGLCVGKHWLCPSWETKAKYWRPILPNSWHHLHSAHPEACPFGLWRVRRSGDCSGINRILRCGSCWSERVVRQLGRQKDYGSEKTSGKPFPSIVHLSGHSVATHTYCDA